MLTIDERSAVCNVALYRDVAEFDSLHASDSEYHEIFEVVRSARRRSSSVTLRNVRGGDHAVRHRCASNVEDLLNTSNSTVMTSADSCRRSLSWHRQCRKGGYCRVRVMNEYLRHLIQMLYFSSCVSIGLRERITEFPSRRAESPCSINVIPSTLLMVIL